MRYHYVVILKKNSERTTDLLSILLCLFSAISFIIFAISAVLTEAHTPARFYLLSIVALLLLTGLVVNFETKRRSSVRGRIGAQVRYRYLLLVAAICWIGLTTLPWLGIFFFALAFLEYQTKRPLEIGFDRDRVVINSLIKRRYDWSAFNNIILKDGLLTLDFIDNRLLQKEVADDEDEDDADEDEFNAYCRVRLAETNKLPAGI